VVARRSTTDKTRKRKYFEVLKAFLDESFSKVEIIYICTCYACFIRRILVALNAIKTIDNEMINLTKLRSLSIV
jgi:hypothetical protein